MWTSSPGGRARSGRAARARRARGKPSRYGEDPRHGRERHRERLGDRGCREAQAAKLQDRLHPLVVCAVGHASGRRGATVRLAREAVALGPFAGAAHAHTRRCRRRRQCPALHHDAPRELAASAPTENRVTVKPHPVSSLDWGAWQLPASKGARMNQRAQELHLDVSRRVAGVGIAFGFPAGCTIRIALPNGSRSRSRSQTWRNRVATPSGFAHARASRVAREAVVARLLCATTRRDHCRWG